MPNCGRELYEPSMASSFNDTQSMVLENRSRIQGLVLVP